MTNKVIYNFVDMDVDVGKLKEVISGNTSALQTAFWWSKTPQGYSYWDEQCFGDDLLQVEVLEDMLEQYKQWVNPSKQENTDTMLEDKIKKVKEAYRNLNDAIYNLTELSDSDVRVEITVNEVSVISEQYVRPTVSVSIYKMM